jgi:uncharacterized protein (DUF169 family)
MNKYDWNDLVSRLNQMLRISATPVGLKFFENKEDINQIPKVRTHNKRFAPCMIIGQAVQFSWTVACLHDNIHNNYCRGIHGMFERDEKWHSGEVFNKVWYDNIEASKSHNKELICAPFKYEAMVVSPLASNRIEEPDVCLIYINTAQAFLLLSGYQFHNYEKLEFSFVGESTCSDSWIKTLVTGKLGVSIPCFAERKFCGVREDEIAISMKPEDFVRALNGVEGLYKNGLRYPIPPYSLTTDMMDGLPERYYEF